MTTDVRTVGAVPAINPPRWYRALTNDALSRYRSGTAWTCDHAPSYGLGLPVAAASWEPGLVVCATCLPALDIGDQAAIVRCCDGCGKPRATPFGVRDGRLLMFVLVCPRCRGWLRVAKIAPPRHVRGSGRRRVRHGRRSR
ncbi:hypothetical protein UG55_103529 [Frankia sp. EI5c]|uniref:hypothetical protein n=1 Tax=Frankia sp. EI5c TaxID=683316 RepID=UPI0007C26AEC|nr:hypothetical protein [Frankia sp. EI5c]OAA23595.1 hypothetical protein UG55_103529 [Frankia sp. EI5c]